LQYNVTWRCHADLKRNGLVEENRTPSWCRSATENGRETQRGHTRGVSGSRPPAGRSALYRPLSAPYRSAASRSAGSCSGESGGPGRTGGTPSDALAPDRACPLQTGPVAVRAGARGCVHSGGQSAVLGRHTGGGGGVLGWHGSPCCAYGSGIVGGAGDRVPKLKVAGSRPVARFEHKRRPGRGWSPEPGLSRAPRSRRGDGHGDNRGKGRPARAVNVGRRAAADVRRDLQRDESSRSGRSSSWTRVPCPPTQGGQSWPSDRPRCGYADVT